MKRENKAYSYKEQIIELELQEVKGPLEPQQIVSVLMSAPDLDSLRSCRS